MEPSIEAIKKATIEHLNQYEELEIIGRGSFGIIRKVKHKKIGRILARKEISYKALGRKEHKQLKSEFNILKRLYHPNIVQVYYDYDAVDKEILYIYMEYCDDGDLGTFIKKNKQRGQCVPETIIWQIFTQLLLALYRCHHGIEISPVRSIFKDTTDEPQNEPQNLQIILHRDIKPENIFLLKDKYTVKLGDFGLAKKLAPQTHFTQTYVGTPYYMPPEVINEQAYSTACDIWSLGCVMYELCALEPPFKAKTHLELQEKIKTGSYKELPDYYSIRLKFFIYSCLVTNTEERADIYKLLQNSSIKIFRKEWELNQRELELVKNDAEIRKHENELKKYEISIEQQQQYLKKTNEKLKNSKQYLINLKNSLDEKQMKIDYKAEQLNIESEKFRNSLVASFQEAVDAKVKQTLSEYMRKS